MEFDLNNNNNNSKICYNYQQQPVPKMSTSPSTISSTAALSNLSPTLSANYSRLTIRMLSDFLASNSQHLIFNKIHYYAPDNLAWLWAFIDWDSDIELNEMPTQEFFQPIEFINNLDEASPFETLNNAPLIQFAYKDQINISDIYNLMNYVMEIESKPIAIILFLLYFPRFSSYIKDQFKNKLHVPLLKCNLKIIKQVDNQLTSLIKSRYTNLREYKENILSGHNLPTYVYTILNENGFWDGTEHHHQQQQQKLELEQKRILTKNIIDYQLLSQQQQQPQSSSCSSTTTSPFQTNNNNNNNNSSVFTFESEVNKMNDYYSQELVKQQQRALFKFNNNNNNTNRITPRLPPPPIQKYSNFNDNNPEYTDNEDNIWSSPVVNIPTITLSRQKFLKQHHLSSGTDASSASPPSSDNNNFLFNNNSQDEAAMNLKQRSSFISPSILNQRQTMNNKFSDLWLSSSRFNSQRLNNYHQVKPNIHSNGSIPSRSRHSSSNVESLYNESIYLSSPNTNNNVFFSNDHNKLDCEEWIGQLAAKSYPENAIYSRKVFIGGVPWDCENQALQCCLNKYIGVKLENPGKDQKHPRASSSSKSNDQQKPGYTYAIFDNEIAVQKLIADCREETKNGGKHYYYRIYVPQQQQQQITNSLQQQTSKRSKLKEIEIVPWNQDDTSYVPDTNPELLPSKIDNSCTIFVGGLHGMLNAQGLAKIMSEKFGEVFHSGLDTDKYKYPIGSGRVTFRYKKDYIKAVKSRHLRLVANQDPNDPSPKFIKIIQIDPYLEDATCSKCENRASTFCRNENCLNYYCVSCSTFRHDSGHVHELMSRQTKPNNGC